MADVPELKMSCTLKVSEDPFISFQSCFSSFISHNSDLNLSKSTCWMGGMAGVYDVVCDVTQQTVTVSSNLSPRVIVALIRQGMGSADIIDYLDPLQPTFEAPPNRTRYLSYDDSYSYDGRTGYTPAYTAPYNGRSYDNEFRPSDYGGRRGSYGRDYH
uniref:HMA domain-containing protein n=1 Tax=Physcomitrium patens TaxID=3218 RepID=A0A2K1KFZ7_PHYPA|nr:hypothetical protein PHYPA_009082 [Physcomitrium patens]